MLAIDVPCPWGEFGVVLYQVPNQIKPRSLVAGQSHVVMNTVSLAADLGPELGPLEGFANRLHHRLHPFAFGLVGYPRRLYMIRRYCTP